MAPSNEEPNDSNTSTKVEQNYSKTRVGEGDVRLDQDRLAQALADEKKRKGTGDDGERQGKKRKGGFETSTHEVTEEELGELNSYILTQVHTHSCCRGVPYDSAYDGGSYGQLRRRGILGFYYFSILYFPRFLVFV